MVGVPLLSLNPPETIKFSRDPQGDFVALVKATNISSGRVAFKVSRHLLILGHIHTVMHLRYIFLLVHSVEESVRDATISEFFNYLITQSYFLQGQSMSFSPLDQDHLS